MSMPFQLVKSTILHFAHTAAHSAHAPTRTIIKDLHSVDVKAFNAALAKKDAHHCNVIRAISTLSVPDQSFLHKVDSSQPDTCPFCRQAVASGHHTIWSCTHPDLVQARTQITHDDQRTLIDNVEHL
eukprot:11045721-Karenia_brevis.AAC.1